MTHDINVTRKRPNASGFRQTSRGIDDCCVNLKRGRGDAATATINNVYDSAPGNDKSPPFLEGRLLYTVPALDNREQPVRWVTTT